LKHPLRRGKAGHQKVQDAARKKYCGRNNSEKEEPKKAKGGANKHENKATILMKESSKKGAGTRDSAI